MIDGGNGQFRVTLLSKQLEQQIDRERETDSPSVFSDGLDIVDLINPSRSIRLFISVFVHHFCLYYRGSVYWSVFYDEFVVYITRKIVVVTGVV